MMTAIILTTRMAEVQNDAKQGYRRKTARTCDSHAPFESMTPRHMAYMDHILDALLCSWKRCHESSTAPRILFRAELCWQTSREHLFRSHIAPIHCERCLTKFRSVVALDTHRRVENACQLKNGERPKGITLAQERQLRNRKKNSVGQTDEERWMEIWTVLFPNDPCPQSPCTIIPLKNNRLSCRHLILTLL